MKGICVTRWEKQQFSHQQLNPPQIMRVGCTCGLACPDGHTTICGSALRSLLPLHCCGFHMLFLFIVWTIIACGLVKNKTVAFLELSLSTPFPKLPWKHHQDCRNQLKITDSRQSLNMQQEKQTNKHAPLADD